MFWKASAEITPGHFCSLPHPAAVKDRTRWMPDSWSLSTDSHLGNNCGRLINNIIRMNQGYCIVEAHPNYRWNICKFDHTCQEKKRRERQSLNAKYHCLLGSSFHVCMTLREGRWKLGHLPSLQLVPVQHNWVYVTMPNPMLIFTGMELKTNKNKNTMAPKYKTVT